MLRLHGPRHAESALSRLRCYEIWCFVYAKARNVPDRMRFDPNVGDIWTWVALDAEMKLVPSWMLGGRDAGTAEVFMRRRPGRG